MKRARNALLIFLGMFVFVLAMIAYLRHVPDAVKNDNDFVFKITSDEQFDSFASEPLLNIYGNIKAVKLVYELDRKRLFFVNGNKYKLHHTFCKEVLGGVQNSQVFNVINYSKTPLRTFALANLNYFPKQDVYAIEFMSEDYLSIQQINELITAVRTNLNTVAPLKLFVNNDYLRAIQGDLDIDAIRPQEVFNSASFQIVQQGEVKGRLRYIESKSDMKAVGKNDIVVVHGSPIYIPNCAGVISDAFQTPLSHIQIMTKDRGIPSMVCRKIFENQYKKLNGRWVQLAVRADTFSLVVAAEQKLERTDEVKEKISLQSNVDFKEVRFINDLTFQDKNKIGNKAAGFAFLASKQNNDFKVPEGAFAIPFYYYNAHIENESIDKLISSLNSQSEIEIRKTLKEIRREIKETPVSQRLKFRVEKMLSATDYKRFRFRSSANAEDLPNYSGAGLYKSKTAILNTDRTIEKAILDVWASAWTWRAYNERRQARINKREFQMGILVHRSFPNEESNGVLISQNIYNEKFIGYTVNVQQGGISVVQPADSIQCDQLILFESSDFSRLQRRIAAQYISIGNQNKGKAVLSAKQNERLYSAAKVLHDNFLADTENQSIDIEFKFDKGSLYIKQIRRYR